MGPFFFSLARMSRSKNPVKTARRQYWRYCEGQKPGELVHFVHPGAEGYRHVVTAIVATLKKGGIELLTVQDEGQMILRSYCHTTLTVITPVPIRSGKAVSVTLHCNQDPENVASLTVWGYTEPMGSEEDDVLL